MSRFQMLSDAQWSLIESMLPRPTSRCRRGRGFSDARTMVEAIVYRCRTGIAWRDLPEVFGPWQTVWTWHQHTSQGAGSNYTNPLLEPPDHGIGRSRGGLSTKIHQLVDGKDARW